MEEKKLFLLDAYALIYRAYYALIRAPRLTSKGFNTSAVFGFCNTLHEVLRKEDPSHIAVCFDPKGETFRHEAYPDYKAGRDAQPEDITLSIPYIKRIVEACRIPVIEKEGFEADDVIGTLSRRAEAEGFVTYMMTPDKDYGQLVTDRILMYRPSLRGEGFEIRGPREICERYGISRPAQVIDLLALEGDSSDNIPGCPGVGEKTAQKLIAEWDSVENMLSHADEIKGALGKRVRDNAEQIRFSKFLATIRTDVPVVFDPEALVRSEVDVDALVAVYRELEFNSFIKRLGFRSGENAQAQAALRPDPVAQADGGQSLFDFDDATGETLVASAASDVHSLASGHSYTVAETPADAARAIGRAAAEEVVGVAMNCSGADEAMTAEWLGLALAFGDRSACYIPLPDPIDPARAELMTLMGTLFGSGKTMIVSHDVKRDMLLLRREGIDLSAPYFDTSVAHYLIEPEMTHKLPQLAMRYLEYYMADSPQKGETDTVGDEIRCCEAADITLRLHAVLARLIDERGARRLFDDVELPLIAVLADMEFTGVRIDSRELSGLSASYTRRLSDMEEEVYRLAGTRFNLASPSQVGEVLFDHLKISAKAKRTKKGSYSTTEEILEKYRSEWPVVDLILKIRALRKLLTTYIDALPRLVNPATGHIHTSYNQTVTATGRISSTNPNLQNIPIRSDDGREIRRAFIADPGCVFLSADYSQIELRLIADMSGDEDMIGAFLSGEDIHRATAAKIYHMPLSEVTDTQRRNAKTANFGIIYGISAFGLAERLGIPRVEAKELIDGYFRSYPRIKDYIEQAVEQARADGYVSTIMGRKRYLPDITSRNSMVRSYAERNAVNAPIQGSAADIIKAAMVSIHREMRSRGLRSAMIMQVHDELCFNVVVSELPEVQEIVARCMSAAYRGRVPLEVSAGTGSNWLEAHS